MATLAIYFQVTKAFDRILDLVYIENVNLHEIIRNRNNP